MPQQVLIFGLVGVVGYLVDAGVLHLVGGAVGLYGGRVVSYIAATAVTFTLNRRFTFAIRGRENFFRQWGLFVVANLGGGMLNYAVFAAVITYAGSPWSNPWFAVALGSLCGMAVNFTMSKRVVFGR